MGVRLYVLSQRQNHARREMEPEMSDRRINQIWIGLLLVIVLIGALCLIFLDQTNAGMVGW